MSHFIRSFRKSFRTFCKGSMMWMIFHFFFFLNDWFQRGIPYILNIARALFFCFFLFLIITMTYLRARTRTLFFLSFFRFFSFLLFFLFYYIDTIRPIHYIDRRLRSPCVFLYEKHRQNSFLCRVSFLRRSETENPESVYIYVLTLCMCMYFVIKIDKTFVHIDVKIDWNN